VKHAKSTKLPLNLLLIPAGLLQALLLFFCVPAETPKPPSARTMSAKDLIKTEAGRSEKRESTRRTHGTIICSARVGQEPIGLRPYVPTNALWR